ncbi:MAG: phosphoribosylformylglycinamidine synthase subunit PurL [Leptospiraceae bacterium]|nr:phosphoribosylformylglycinamidine synthase subunit PurL [Leptospiraceae bacterium]MDW8305809.1 phosphoribosylformylglycinamidine synthase subunit PurL [Leptospiraceae bacterium]
MFPSDRAGTKEDALNLGLLEKEYEKICMLLGRTPTFTELAMFSGMWSEHCSYKNSKLLLRNLYCESPRLLARPGEENAGVLKISDNLAVVFKIESHNHPSAIEPYQGAATGVGGIMRDVFTMGARPLVSLNSLRFGYPTDKRNRYLLKNVVRGIADYGNSLGIACAGGEVFFHDSYSKNPLVNAMTVGIAPIDKLASARRGQAGQYVMYAGARTGRDGIHGASFASKEISEDSFEERSAVQVGDPFLEKLLMEATLECLHKGLVVAIQDMGAAGLVSSTSEMASSGGFGMILDLEKIPTREKDMEPYEYLLSESQERMLLLVEREKVQEIHNIFAKWELEAQVIGVTTAAKELVIRYQGKEYARLSPDFLVKEAPLYEREFSPTRRDLWQSKAPRPIFEGEDLETIMEIPLLSKALEFFSKLLSEPNFASKAPIYEQYDCEVGLGRIIGPGENAGVYRVGEGSLALAVTVDGNSLYVAQDPFEGTRHTVAEAYRNISAAGAYALGITNCLNFGNPYKPDNYYYFRQAVLGMSQAAKELNVPITGGNVSFYNESEEGPVLPTPTIGMVGLLEDEKEALTSHAFLDCEIALLGFFNPRLEGSLFHYLKTGILSDRLPPLSLKEEKKTAGLLLQLNKKKLLRSAIDLSSGGLILGLLRFLFAGRRLGQKHLGFAFKSLSLLREEFRNYDTLFLGETASTYLVCYEREHRDKIAELAQREQVPFRYLGETEASDSFSFGKLHISLRLLQEIYEESLRVYLR